MKNTVPRTAALAVALGFLLSGAAAAQSATPKAEPSTERELAAAREDLQRAARRVAELSRALGHRGEQLRHVEKRLVRKPVLGVLLAPDEQTGVRIAGVTPDSAAAQGGLKSGDRLTAIAGSEILGSNGELRVVNARKLLGDLDSKTPVRLAYLRNGKPAMATVTPRIGERVVVLPGDGQQPRIRIERDGDGEHVFEFDTDELQGMVAPHARSQIHKEIIRLGPDGNCKGANCRMPMLLSAFRWNGLNLASLDPQLGRYFGTDKGVLVLSSGELDGLQGGDVIQTVDGRRVDSPREVMDALRDKPANARVAVGYLRDRKATRTNVTVPDVMRDLPLPPTPPAPPAAPRPPSPPRMSAPPAVPAPPAPPPPAATIEVPPAPDAPSIVDA